LELAGGQTVKLEERVFAGAKQVHLLDHYEKTYGIARFDLAIDFGWFYFLTKPIFSFLNMINSLLGNFGLSILLLTVLIKLALFPLANKSYRSMAKMKSLAPELAKLKEKHGDDRIKMNEEMMGLYRKYQINPLAGCLPMVLQIPVFFALYKVLFVTIEMRHAPFFGWIHDLSAPDPTTLFNLFGLIPWTPPSYLMIGIWPILMGLTMFMQQRLNPQPSDPIQAKMFMFMPLFFTALLAQFSAGLVIYWAWNNMLSIAQQALIMRMEAGKPLLAAANKNTVKPKWKK
jgi:YidC/Oxa1 family membrane protein insertase